MPRRRRESHYPPTLLPNEVCARPIPLELGGGPLIRSLSWSCGQIKGLQAPDEGGEGPCRNGQGIGFEVEHYERALHRAGVRPAGGNPSSSNSDRAGRFGLPESHLKARV